MVLTDSEVNVPNVPVNVPEACQMCQEAEAALLAMGSPFEWRSRDTLNYPSKSGEALYGFVNGSRRHTYEVARLSDGGYNACWWDGVWWCNRLTDDSYKAEIDCDGHEEWLVYRTLAHAQAACEQHFAAESRESRK